MPRHKNCRPQFFLSGGEEREDGTGRKEGRERDGGKPHRVIPSSMSSLIMKGREYAESRNLVNNFFKLLLIMDHSVNKWCLFIRNPLQISGKWDDIEEESVSFDSV